MDIMLFARTNGVLERPGLIVRKPHVLVLSDEEAARHHTNHAVRRAAERDRTPDNSCVATELALPTIERQYDLVIVARDFVTGQEGAAEERWGDRKSTRLNSSH